MNEMRARSGLAAELVDSGEPQRAIDLLQPVIDAQPSAPYGAARAWLISATRTRTSGDAIARSRPTSARSHAHRPTIRERSFRARARRATVAIQAMMSIEIFDNLVCFCA